MPPRELRLGTRGSPLAVWQARAVADRIAASGGPPCAITLIKTSGDQIRQAPLSPAGGKRLFVKEIEDALLQGDIDLAVHSAKDMPALLPEGLVIAAVLPREDPRDTIVLPGREQECSALTVDAMAARLAAAVVGTGSVRRVAQLVPLVPGARFTGIRGNIETRLRKLDEGQYDALVLAAAGLRRLGFESRISLSLPPSVCVPAPGQGLIAVEIRENDDASRAVVAPIGDPTMQDTLAAERALVAGLGGGCQTPVGALASPLPGGGLELLAVVAALDGSKTIRATERGRDAERLGADVAARLVAEGARELLAAARTPSGAGGRR